MGIIATDGLPVWRDHATQGVPASGANQPSKPAIRNWVTAIDERVEEIAAIAAVDSVAKESVQAATTAALPACTYANGTAGVGATLTGNANGALAAQDGVTLTVNQRLLVKNQASGLQNWIYALTQVGTGGTPFILTRATDSDTPAEIAGAYVFVPAGTANAGSAWAATLPVASITIGTTDLTPAQISGPGGIAAEATARAAADALMWLGKWPFLPAVTDEYMRRIVKDFVIEGGDAGHAYVLNYESLDTGAGNGRVRFKLYDSTLGIHVCTWVEIDTQANFAAKPSPTVFLYQGDLAGYTGITATAWINWPAVTDWTKALTTYTSPDDAGIRTDLVITPGEIRERFKRGAEPKIRLTVGAGTPTATHYNTVLAAVQSLYIPGITVTRSTYPLSDICTFSNQALVEVIDDGYSEDIALVTIATVDQSPLVLPPFITLRGRSSTDTRIFSNEATNGGPVIEAPFPFRIEEMKVDNDGAGGGYAVHVDNANDRAKRSTAAGDRAVLRYPMVSVFKKATLMCGASALTWVIGCGISNGHTIRLERSRVIVPTGKVGLGIHTLASTTDPGEIEVIETYFSDAGADAISLLKGFAQTVQHRLLVQGSDLDEIVVNNTAGGASGFIREGKIDAGITITGTLDT